MAIGLVIYFLYSKSHSRIRGAGRSERLTPSPVTFETAPGPGRRFDFPDTP